VQDVPFGNVIDFHFSPFIIFIRTIYSIPNTIVFAGGIDYSGGDVLMKQVIARETLI
jgi:hypothetical protein